MVSRFLIMGPETHSLLVLACVLQTKLRRDNMTLMVYWYGTAGSGESYSFINPRLFKPYNGGADELMDRMPPKLRKKVATGSKKLTKAEEDLVQAFEEMRTDIDKQPEERRRRGLPFKELHEDDKTLLILIGASDLTDDSYTEPEQGEDEDNDQGEKEESDNEAVVKTPTAKAKLTKKAEKIKPAKTIDDEMEDFDNDVSSDDAKDKDVEPSADEDDALDEDFEEEMKGPPSQKRKGQKTKHKIQRNRQKTPKSESAKKPREPKMDVTLTTLKMRERHLFQDNEDQFCPMVKTLKAAIESNDAGDVEQVLKELIENVESMGALFIEEYKISPLLKTVKVLLKENNADLSTFNVLWQKLKVLYTEKKQVVPKGYKPRRQKQAEQDTAISGEVSHPDKEDSKAKPVKSITSKTQKGESTSKPIMSGSKDPGSMPPSKQKTSNNGPLGSPKSKADTSSKALIPKTEKKTFSLNKLFNPKSDERPRSKSVDDGQSGRKSMEPSLKKLPSWITDAPGELEPPLPSDEIDRALALEFFEGAASRFPEDKVNRDAIARSLETAVYLWSQEQHEKVDSYWNKLHAIVAGICGKRKPGFIVTSIVAGEYASAKDVVALPEDVIYRSFQG